YPRLIRTYAEWCVAGMDKNNVISDLNRGDVDRNDELLSNLKSTLM
ncbi:5554_t:CDS:1, partial [Racocetra persica]